MDIFVKPSGLELTQKRLDDYKKLCEIIQWGRKNPVRFVDEFLGISLLDHQAYTFTKSWTVPYVMWVESRAIGKTTESAIFIAAKLMLFSHFEAVISSGTGTQSIETFQKLEAIAKRNIASFLGATDIFENELIKTSNSDGFIHNPASFSCQLFNGSRVRTINSAIDQQRGKRANLVLFDEAGWLSNEHMTVIGAYASNDADFKLGGDINIETLPKEVPNQILIASSASSVDTEMYKRYRDYSKKMLLGDKRYFVADMPCTIAINATYKGKVYPKSVLTQETVDAEMRQNPYKAMREYYNKFSDEGGANCIIRREWIARNSIVMPPTLSSTGGEYGIAYDPARVVDNAFVLIGEFILDEKKGWMLKIVNGVNFADLDLKNRTPMRQPDQIRYLRKLIMEYNGDADNYKNVRVIMDGGSGGGGAAIPDMLMESWYDDGHDGSLVHKHPGIIDKVYSAEYVSRFPDAVNVLTVSKPSADKSDMFEELIQNVLNDLIIFPERYDNRGFLNIVEVDDKKLKSARRELQDKGMKDEDIAAEMVNIDAASVKTYQLNIDEECALKQIDMMVEEIVRICRFKLDGTKDRFALPPHKNMSAGIDASDRTMHDDRAYTLAMLSRLLTMRRNSARKFERKKSPKELISKMPFTTYKLNKTVG